jgi:hypothetical protein
MTLVGLLPWSASPVYPEFFFLFLSLRKKFAFLMNSHIRLLLTKQCELSGEVLYCFTMLGSPRSDERPVSIEYMNIWQ